MRAIRTTYTNKVKIAIDDKKKVNILVLRVKYLKV